MNEQSKPFESEPDYFEMTISLDGAKTVIDLNAVKEQIVFLRYDELDRVANIMSEFYSEADPIVVIPIKNKCDYWNNFLAIFSYIENKPRLILINKYKLKGVKF